MRIFRSSFLLVLAVFVSIGAAAFWVFRNGMVERMIERQLTTAFDAQSDIDDLSFNIFNMGAGFSHLSIGDKDQPMRNLVETGNARFHLELTPLLMRKVVIDEMSIEQIGVQTPRNSNNSAAILHAPTPGPAAEAPSPPPATAKSDSPSPSATAPATPNAWDKLRAQTPKIDLQALEQRVDVTGLVQQGGLGSVKYVNEIKESRTKMFKDWDDRLNKSNLEHDFESLLADIKRIDVAAIKDPKAAKDALEALKSARDKHEKVKSTFNGMNFDAQRDLATLKDTWQGLNQRVDDDVNAVKRLAKLSGINTRDAAQMVFGPAILQQFSTINGYLGRAKRIVSGDPADKKPPRRAGVNIQFPLEKPRPPDFLIRHIGVSGTLADQTTKISGDLRGVTTQPDAYGLPTTLQLRMISAARGVWKVNGEFDHRKTRDLDSLSFKGDNIDLGRIELQSDGNNPMPSAFHPRDADITLAMQLDQGKLRGEIALIAPKVEFDFGIAPAANATAEVVRKLFADIHDVRIEGQVGGTWDQPTLKLQSNVDTILSQRLGQIIQQKTAAVEQQIRQAIDAQILKEKAQVDVLIKGQQTALENRMKALAGNNAEVAKAVDKAGKELEKKSTQGAKDVGKKLEDQAKSKLKSLKF
ncbi:MAG: TIGR03545 family protein [Pseudomonadota bacterium]